MGRQVFSYATITNHSDAPEHDSEAHGNHKEPKIEDVAKYEPSVEMPSTDPPTGQVEITNLQPLKKLIPIL